MNCHVLSMYNGLGSQIPDLFKSPWKVLNNDTIKTNKYVCTAIQICYVIFLWKKFSCYIIHFRNQSENSMDVPGVLLHKKLKLESSKAYKMLNNFWKDRQKQVRIAQFVLRSQSRAVGNSKWMNYTVMVLTNFIIF